MNFCSIFKLTRVDVGNVSKKGKNMKYLKYFTRWFFNQNLSINMAELFSFRFFQCKYTHFESR